MSESKHLCASRQRGDWLYFKCPLCDYQRKMNWKTGEMKTFGGKEGVLHAGFNLPPEKIMEGLNLN